jgi:hypothetical protein
MRKAVPLFLILGFTLTSISVAQTTYLGNILQLHRQDAGSLPAATNYQGSIVYDTGGNTIWYSNGTAWQPIDTSGGGGSTAFWQDAGTTPNAIYNDPVTTQVRVGNRESPAYTGFTPVAGYFGTPDGGLGGSNLLVYTDGGLGVIIYTDRKTRTVTVGNMQPGTSWFGAGLSLLTDRVANGDDYAQIFFGARGTGLGTIQHGALTYAAVPVGTYGIVNGMTLSSGANIGFVTGDNYVVAYPTFYLSNSQTASLGNVAPSTLARLNINAIPVNAAIRIEGVTGGTAAILMAGNNYGVDFGTGSNDDLFSDGTRLRVGNLSTSGGLNAFTYRVVGNASGADMVASATTGNGGIGFRQADNQLYTMSSGKESRPILSGPDWVYDGRVWNVDVNWENTACPVVRNTLIQSTGGDVTVDCEDTGAAGVVSGAGFPSRGYRTFTTGAAIGSRSGFTSGTMPASGVGGTPQLFVQRTGGPIVNMWVRTGGALTDTRFYAGLTSAIPASGTPVPNAAVYVRYDTSAGDARFFLCTVASTTATCNTTGITPAINTEYLITLDCRESSTACRIYIDGANQGANTTNLPGLAANMGFVFAIEATSAAARTFGLGRTSIRTE